MNNDQTKENNKKWYKTWWGLIGAIMLFPIFLIWYAWAESKWSQNVKVAVTVVMAILMLASFAASPSEDKDAPVAENQAQAAEQTEDAEKNEVTPKEEANEEPEVKNTEVVENSEPAPAEEAEVADETESLTVSQKNAIRSAESYISFSGFSRQGLIDQLSSEYGDQYSVADATFAVDSLNIDYNEQAQKSAKAYLDVSGFSCQGLVDQLASDFGDQYTLEQAQFGAKAVGAC